MIPNLPLGWLAESGPPWAFFLLALLTRPATWSDTMVRLVRSRTGGSHE